MSIDIVSQVTKLVNQFERGMITADEYASELLTVAANAGREAIKTYTFITMCDGKVVCHQTELSLADLKDALYCYKCDPTGAYADKAHVDCPSDNLISQVESKGEGSVIHRDNFCGDVDVMIAYENKND